MLSPRNVGVFVLALRFVASFCYVCTGSFAQDKSLEDTEVVINFAGDCMFAGHFEEHIGDRFDLPFAQIPWFGQADISMVNLENPITTHDRKIPKQFNFRMHPKYLQVLLHGGVDIVTIANNHIYDFGREGLFDTIRYLDSVGIKHVGAGRTISEARKPVVVDVKGLRIGLLGYWGNGDWHPATEKRPGTALRLRTYIEEDVKHLKEVEKADFVVVNFHWGEEKEHYPTEYQKSLGRFTIDVGADFVIGHHPHVLQGIERYRHGIIVYSLGNFLFGGNSRREYDTAVFEVRIRSKVMTPRLIPIRVMDWQAFALEGKEGERIIESVKQYSQIFPASIF